MVLGSELRIKEFGSRVQGFGLGLGVSFRFLRNLGLGFSFEPSTRVNTND